MTKEEKKTYDKEYRLKNNEKLRQYRLENAENKRMYDAEYQKKQSTEKKEYNKKRYLENKEKISIARKKYYLVNKENILSDRKIYYSNNIENILNKKRIYRIENAEKIRNVRLNNLENIRNYYNVRYENDILYKLSHSIRCLIRGSIKNGGYSKLSKTEDILGCSFNEFKEYLESKFEFWMNWNNYGNSNGISDNIT